MPNYRRNRINDEVTRELGSIMLTIKDPRITKRLVSITAADVTPDLKFCKIYFSATGTGKYANDADREVADAFASASGFIRRELAKRLNLRITPELRFIADDSIKYGAHINDVLRSLNIPEDGEDDANDISGEDGE